MKTIFVCMLFVALTACSSGDDGLAEKLTKIYSECKGTSNVSMHVGSWDRSLTITCTETAQQRKP